jgi:hypothetical protein
MASIKITYDPVDNTIPTGINRAKVVSEEEFIYEISNGVIDFTSLELERYRIDWDGGVPSIRLATTEERKEARLEPKRAFYLAKLLEIRDDLLTDSEGLGDPMKWHLLWTAYLAGNTTAAIKTRIQAYCTFVVTIAKGYYNYKDQLENAATYDDLLAVAAAAQTAIESVSPPADTLDSIFNDIVA